VFSILGSRISWPQLTAAYVVLATGMAILGAGTAGIYDYSYISSMIDVQLK
jgi:hypothetical protein